LRRTGKKYADKTRKSRPAFRYKKRYGQNFLHDTVKVQRIISAVSPGKNDIFLEIGPGSGNITKELAPKAGRVVVVEIDGEAIEKLKERNICNLEIINSDFMNFDFGSIKTGLKKTIRVIGNIPYYITVPILEKIIDNRNNVRDAYFTVQKEVAERICAPEGSKTYGSLSVFIQYYADAEIIFKIGRKSFFPVPKVDSAFIRLKFRDGKIKVKSEEMFFRLVRGVFGVRRKTLANGLRKVFILDFAKISDLLYNMKN